jgi:coenzyme F420-reducing hydrogenase gamma subunit
MKPKVGVFSFTSCEGCQLEILNCEDEMLDLLAAIDLVNFREAIDDRDDDYEIAFVEGSVTTPEEVHELQGIRNRARILVATGACACLGGINALKNLHDISYVRRKVYGESSHCFPTEPTKRITDVVRVDYELHGCPISKREFLEVTKALLLGLRPEPSNHAVCTECKQRANVCVFEKGMVCLGPITRAGCRAICPSFGGACVGCRGLVSNPNLASMIDVMKSKGLSRTEVEERLTQFNALTPIDLSGFFEDRSHGESGSVAGRL